MANLTLTIDDELLRRARIRALEQGTSVNAAVRRYLEAFAGGSTSRDTISAFLEIASRVHAGSGPEGRGWNRNDIYEERVG